MSEALLPCVEIDPRAGKPEWAVVCLHGLGADGHDLAGLVPELGLDRIAPIRWVFPHAPRIPVTLNGGMRMPAWYDVRELSLSGRGHDIEGVRRSAAQLRGLIARETGRGLASERIFLAGFSQGGALALYTGLRHADRLAGIVALSTYLIFDQSLESERSAANEGLPIFQAHGTADPMVPFEAGRMTQERLVKLGYDLTWKTYRMAHSIALEEIQDLAAWFEAQVRRPERP
jgi:phospholipase/carboxylesterase